MLDFPKSTAFGRRFPKQKFYENLDVSPEVKRLFVEQVIQAKIKLILGVIRKETKRTGMDAKEHEIIDRMHILMDSVKQCAVTADADDQLWIILTVDPSRSVKCGSDPLSDRLCISILAADNCVAHAIPPYEVKFTIVCR